MTAWLVGLGACALAAVGWRLVAYRRTRDAQVKVDDARRYDLAKKGDL